MKPQSLTLDDERPRPDGPDRVSYQHHLARYEFLLPMVRNSDDILETGCGAGYGSLKLTERARSVVAIDYSAAALEYARDRYSGRGLTYLLMDCHRLAFAEASFDLVVSFEVFEHLERPEDYLSECRRVLRPGGRLVLSTPNRSSWDIHLRSIRTEYEFHVNMVDLKGLRAHLGRFFPAVEIYSQWRRGNAIHRALRSLDVWNLRLRLVPAEKREKLQQAMGVPTGVTVKSSDWVFTRSQRRQANHFVAICRK
jgi:2-polyprenyl-3-methyl-5-hydroxy-6-metoxy-1,4-benzoquinol methylase